MTDKLKTTAFSLEQETLFYRALQRVSDNPQIYGAISAKDALQNGLITKEELEHELLHPNKEIWAEAEIGWMADDLTGE